MESLKKIIFTVKIDNITKMGVIGYLYDSNDKYNIENSPILFIVPSGYIKDIESLKDVSEVEVLQSRIKYKSKQIQVVGKLSNKNLVKIINIILSLILNMEKRKYLYYHLKTLIKIKIISFIIISLIIDTRL